MERRLNTKVESYLKQFKDDIRNKVMTQNNEKLNIPELLEYIYEYKDGSGFRYKGNWRNTAGWTSVEVAGKIIQKIGPILATKYEEFN